MFNKENGFNARVSALKQFMTVSAPQLIEKVNDPVSYITQVRTPINMSILEIILGATFTPNKKNEIKIRYNRTIPNYSQIYQLTSLMAEFINNIEDPFIESFDVVDNDDDDMGRPKGNGNNPFAGFKSNIPVVSKITRKDMKQIVGVDGNSQFQICSQLLQPEDLLQIAGMAEELKKRIVRQEILIATGVTVTAIAIAGGVWWYIDNKKKNEELSDGTSSDEPIDISVQLDEPHVYLDENSLLSTFGSVSTVSSSSSPWDGIRG